MLDRCDGCGELYSVGELELVDSDGQQLCGHCWERWSAEQHDDGCDCEHCARERSHYEAELRRREAASHGGISAEGLALLGWAE